MREILFRGMTENCKWVYGSLIQHGDYCCILKLDSNDMDFPYLDAELGAIDGYATPVIPETVGEYIGLKDENGIKIFEGDIIEFTSHGYIPNFSYGIITLKNGCYGIKYFVESIIHESPFEYFHRIGQVDRWNEMNASGKIVYTYKLVGNIHDNSECLDRFYSSEVLEKIRKEKN